MAANLIDKARRPGERSPWKLIVLAAAVVGSLIVGMVPMAHAAGITLPGGTTLDVGAGTPEAHLAYALADKSLPLPQTFLFDELTFAAGSWELSADADKTLDHVATILKAYPSARVRIEGRWAKGGSPRANRALAASRARAVKEKLVARGIAPDRIDTTRGGQARAGRAEAGTRANRRAEIVLLRR